MSTTGAIILGIVIGLAIAFVVTVLAGVFIDSNDGIENSGDDMN